MSPKNSQAGSSETGHLKKRNPQRPQGGKPQRGPNAERPQMGIPKKKSFLKVFGWVALMNILARLLGFGREMALAYRFGATAETDAYLLAFTIPNLLFMVLGGALTTAVIPSLVGEVSPEEKWRKVNALVNTLLIGFALLFLAGELFPLAAVFLLAPDAPRQTLELSARLFQIMLPASLFLTAASLFTGVLNAHKRFQIAAVSRLALNLSVVLAILGFGGLIGIDAAAWGVVAGGILFALLQAVQLYRIDYRYQPRLFEPEIRHILLFALPIMLGGAVMQLYTLIGRFFAGGLEEGSIAALNYAFLLMQLPQTVLMSTFASILFPGMAEQAKEGDIEKLSRTFVRGTRLSLMLLVPMSLLFIFFAPELVQLLFGYGAFTANDVRRTAPVLAVLSFGLTFHALNLYWTRFFYSLEETWRPVLVSLAITVGFNSFLSWVLRGAFGLEGLALSISLSGFLNGLVLVWMVSTRLDIGNQVRHLGGVFAKVTLSALVAAAAAYALKLWLSSWLPVEGWKMHLFTLAAGLVVALPLFVVFLKLSRLEEIDIAWRRVKMRLTGSS